VIQIGVHHVGEESDQYIVCVAPRVSCTTIVREVPSKLKSGLCSWDDVFAPSDRPAQPSFWCLILPPLNHFEVGRERFNNVVTVLLGLPGPINPTCGRTNQSLSIRTKMMQSLMNTDRGYHLGTSEKPWPSPHPSLPSDPLFPNCPTRSQQHT
jgi:hypothetical protein